MPASKRPAYASQLAELFRVERFGRYKAAKWHLDAAFARNDADVADGYHVQHCGHPTANYPYTGHAPEGDVIVASNGRGFRLLHDAQLAVVKRAVADRDARAAGATSRRSTKRRR